MTGFFPTELVGGNVLARWEKFYVYSGGTALVNRGGVQLKHKWLLATKGECIPESGIP